VGDVVDGTVTKLMPFGAFVDLGGMDGLIPMGELAWGRVESAEEVVRAGQAVRVMVRGIDWERDRISLSLREVSGSPWQDVERRYPVGSRCGGIVTKLMPFGAFVELEPGVEGLVHISRLGAGKRIGHPREVVSEGQAIEVCVEGIDTERNRISLSVARESRGGEQATGEALATAGEFSVGQQVAGTVDGVRDFGVFVDLGGERTGLLHVSQLDLPDAGNRMRALTKRFQQGDSITVIVRDVRGDRISLTTVEKWQEEAESANLGQYMTDTGSPDFGSLGDALSGLKL
jgi:small subunit ribosomal protein S1